jgi:nitrite reductase/ring-hydroxylating ferredoxin subunit
LPPASSGYTHDVDGTSRDALHRAVGALGEAEALDAVAGPVGDGVRKVLDRQPLKDLLSGVWLGHPLHPFLTDLPIGFWTSAFLLDLLGGRHSRKAATRLVAWGVLSALPTAASGAADWGDTTGPRRRIGLVHATANSVALACYAGSWIARRRGRHARGVVLGFAGATAATVGGYLGGHLLQTLGVGTDQTVTVRPPSEWTRAARLAELGDRPQRTVVGEAPVILLRDGARVVALDARCPHRGAPMDEGTVDDGCITCPWHGSVFRLDDGALVRGPSTVPLPAYEVRVVDGDVEVRAS